MTPEKLTQAQKLLLLSLPPVLFFSAFPALNFTALAPEITSLNLELSLPEFWLILFTIVSLTRLTDPIYLRTFFRTIPKKPFLLSLLFPAYASLSLLWTKNFLRGFLTVAILWLLWFSILNIVTLLKSSPHLRPLLKKSLMLSTIFICIFCWLQCFTNVFLNQNFLLCLGCTYSAFGFPHPNGFTLEPQFMGNLLLAPALLSLKNPSTKRSRLLATFIISTLFLTFSRGAIFSFLLALPILIFTQNSPKISKILNLPRSPIFFIRKIPKTLLKISRIVIISFLISLLAQGLFAQFSPANTTFYDGIRASISQLTLGKITLPDLSAQSSEFPNAPNSFNNSTNPSTLPASPVASVSELSPNPSESSAIHDEPLANSATTSTAVSVPELSSESSINSSVISTPESSAQTPTFSGYVPESTNIRLRLSELALDRWNDDPFSLIFGAGAGSAGASLYEKFPSELGTAKEIVQNEYVSLLLEFGVIPYCIIILLIVKLHKSLRKTFAKNSPLLLAYAFSLLFFSGLPNALHIYLLPFLL